MAKNKVTLSTYTDPDDGLTYWTVLLAGCSMCDRTDEANARQIAEKVYDKQTHAIFTFWDGNTQKETVVKEK